MFQLLKTYMEGFTILFLDSEMTSDVSWMPSPLIILLYLLKNVAFEQLCIRFVNTANF